MPRGNPTHFVPDSTEGLEVRKAAPLWKAKGKFTFSTPEDLRAACEEYFDWVHDHPLYEDKVFNSKNGPVHDFLVRPRPMSIAALLIFLDISKQTLSDYRRRPGYAEVLDRVETVIHAQKFEGAAAELFSAPIIIRDLGMVDKREQTADNSVIQADTLTIARAVLAALNAAARHDDEKVMLLETEDIEDDGKPPDI